jgi:hypothetical protein
MGRLVGALLVVLWAGCGDDPGEPLITTNATGSADGESFDASFGVSTVLDSGTVATVIGSGEINCGSIDDTGLPPSGIYVNIQIPEAVVGVASETFFSFSIVDGGDLSGGGSNSGSVEVTALSDTTIAMTVSYTDTISEKTYSVSGDFEAVRCD